MSADSILVPIESARRLAVTKQRLTGELPGRVNGEAIVALVRDLAYIQWDPVKVVAPSHLLSIWARLGPFRTAELERVLWTDKRLFLHWTPIASIVLTEDYPFYASLMTRYPGSLSPSWGSQRSRIKHFLEKNARLRQRVLGQLRDGPLTLPEFHDHAKGRRESGDWNPSSDVSAMLSHLSMMGEVMVVGHRGNLNLWGLSRTSLPEWVDTEPMPEREFERAAASRTIRVLGTATPREVQLHFVRGRYLHLERTIRELEESGTIVRVEVEGGGPRERRFVHADDVRTLERLSANPPEPRLSLLPPFDNLVISQARAQRIFGFDYVREQFLSKAKRRFGTYVLPILWGERFIGRADLALDKPRRRLEVLAVHAEAAAPGTRALAERIRDRIGDLATFVGADTVRFSSRIPSPWASTLR